MHIRGNCHHVALHNIASAYQGSEWHRRSICARETMIWACGFTILSIIMLSTPTRSQEFEQDLMPDAIEKEFTQQCAMSSRGMYWTNNPPPSSVTWLPRFQRSPVLVVDRDGAPTGSRPQWGPSNVWLIWISFVLPAGNKVRLLSSLRSTILREFANVHSTLMFPASWSNLPPRAPTTSTFSCMN